MTAMVATPEDFLMPQVGKSSNCLLPDSTSRHRAPFVAESFILSPPLYGSSQLENLAVGPCRVAVPTNWGEDGPEGTAWWSAPRICQTSLAAVGLPTTNASPDTKGQRTTMEKTRGNPPSEKRLPLFRVWRVLTAPFSPGKQPRAQTARHHRVRRERPMSRRLSLNRTGTDLFQKWTCQSVEYSARLSFGESQIYQVAYPLYMAVPLKKKPARLHSAHARAPSPHIKKSGGACTDAPLFTRRRLPPGTFLDMPGWAYTPDRPTRQSWSGCV